MSAFGFNPRHFLRVSTSLCWICALVAGGCGQDPIPVAKPIKKVETTIAALKPYSASVTLTGEIKARVQSDVSFRFSGRIATRNVDVGDRVVAGQILATLETTERDADISSAAAGAEAADATLKQAAAAFQRQKELLTKGFTTRTQYDNALRDLTNAQATLDGARATLATARDQLEKTTLRADAAGIVTARQAEAGQVVEAAQAIFTIALNGDRDAVFEVYESLVVNRPSDVRVAISLVSDPTVSVSGTVREVSPVINAATGTVRVKVGIDHPPSNMELGATVAGVGRFQPRNLIELPAGAFFVDGGRPAVWVVNPQNMTVSLKPVVIDSYRTGVLLISDGLSENDQIVTSGAQLLQPGQVIKPVMATQIATPGGKL